MKLQRIDDAVATLAKKSAINWQMSEFASTADLNRRLAAEHSDYLWYLFGHVTGEICC